MAQIILLDRSKEIINIKNTLLSQLKTQILNFNLKAKFYSTLYQRNQQSRHHIQNNNKELKHI